MEWIAIRKLTDDLGNDVTIAVGAPSCDGPDKWTCAFQVTGLVGSQDDTGTREAPSDEVMRATGMDGFQALLLAIRSIYSWLEESPRPLTWRGGEAGDTGIPRLATMTGGLSLRQHIENVMSAEEQFWRSLLSTWRRETSDGADMK